MLRMVVVPVIWSIWARCTEVGEPAGAIRRFTTGRPSKISSLPGVGLEDLLPHAEPGSDRSGNDKRENRFVLGSDVRPCLLHAALDACESDGHGFEKPVAHKLTREQVPLFTMPCDEHASPSATALRMVLEETPGRRAWRMVNELNVGLSEGDIPARHERPIDRSVFRSANALGEATDLEQRQAGVGAMARRSAELGGEVAR